MRARSSRWVAVLRTPLGGCAVVLLVLILALAVAAPLLWGAAATAVDTDAIHQGPSAAHPFGTDGLGRDLLARTLVATRLSIGLALSAMLIGVAIGTLLGTAPAVLPRRVGRLIGSAVNIAVAFPGLLLALFFAVIFGVGTTGAVLAIGLATAPSFARVAQTLSAAVAGRDFVSAARVAGVGRIRVLVRHVLPNIAEPLVVNATIGAGAALLSFAGLSFLGIGVQAPSYDWGRLLGDGLNRIYTNPAAALGPGAAVVLAGLAFNLCGEAIAAALGHRTPARRLGRPAESAAAVAPERPDPAQPVLRVEGLSVRFPTAAGFAEPVRGVTFSLRPGAAVGMVGESGSGKSLTALAAARLIERPGLVHADRLEFAGRPLSSMSERAARSLLGTRLAMVFQDPTTSFNPTRRIGRQLAEVAQEHQGLGRRGALARAVQRLAQVRVPAPARRANQYPHEFSGGMRQRAMIGMGLMGTPQLIIADEPTTALDVTVQRQVLRLLDRVRRDSTAAILLISHDITVVRQTCDRVLVMYAGRIVEDLPTALLPDGAQHPYTRALLAVVPDLDADRNRPLGVIAGRPPEPTALPAGCAFADRCSFATEECRRDDPRLVQAADGHRVACWHPVTEAPAESATGRRTRAGHGDRAGRRIDAATRESIDE